MAAQGLKLDPSDAKTTTQPVWCLARCSAWGPGVPWPQSPHERDCYACGYVLSSKWKALRLFGIPVRPWSGPFSCEAEKSQGLSRGQEWLWTQGSHTEGWKLTVYTLFQIHETLELGSQGPPPPPEGRTTGGPPASLSAQHLSPWPPWVERSWPWLPHATPETRAGNGSSCEFPSTNWKNSSRRSQDLENLTWLYKNMYIFCLPKWVRWIGK